MSTAYHPETDGQTERANRTIEDILRAYVNTQQMIGINTSRRSRLRTTIVTNFDWFLSLLSQLWSTSLFSNYFGDSSD